MANDRLAAVVSVTSRIQLVTEGGWQYSSPLVREQGGKEIPLLDTPDALSMMALIVGDLDLLSRDLYALVEEAKGLGIDAAAMCGVDLATSARVYQQLAMDLGTASQRAIEAMAQSKPAGPGRRRRSNGASASAAPESPSQTSLLSGSDGGEG
jgi:hypothetical protein